MESTVWYGTYSGRDHLLRRIRGGSRDYGKVKLSELPGKHALSLVWQLLRRPLLGLGLRITARRFRLGRLRRERERLGEPSGSFKEDEEVRFSEELELFSGEDQLERLSGKRERFSWQGERERSFGEDERGRFSGDGERERSCGELG
ncbi:hypothetical protein JG688_00010883 [Phytophthora aleatoria]|uniref:Uncharacterized protein n=1 Tax=Phytophthora aleatoria TaxID=2496075 RepID=A0A8J5IDM6_9STRA|nr:hypothetical protein JG688_00010883 [Phytophthora aleatoria]